jgi:hypothetical protein
MKNIRKIIKTKAFVGHNDEILREQKSGYQEFDRNGNLTREVQYTNGGNIEMATGYTYDENNRIVQEIHYYEEEQVGEVIRYKLGQDGKPVSLETEYADGSTSLKTYTRFENMLSIKSNDEDGDLESEELLKFNENGQVTEEIHFDEDRRIVQKFLNEYNKDKQLVSRTEYGEDEEFVLKILVEYDKEGNVVMETHLNRKDQIMNQVAFTFDKEGNRTSWENNLYLNKTVYDDHNRPIREERINRRNELVEEFTDYEYDDEGKILLERTFSMGEQYELEPGAVARTKSDFILHKYAYEYFEDEG